MESRIKFKIGEIEFEAEGTAEVVERERDAFMKMVLPAAIDAVVCCERKRVTGIAGWIATDEQFNRSRSFPYCGKILY